MTVTAQTTLKTALNTARPEQLADIARQMQLGTMLAPLKRAFTGLASGTTHILTALDATGEVVGASNPNRLAALCVNSLRAVTGTTFVGTYAVSDVGGTVVTPATSTLVGVATLSDDGRTLVFPGAITAFTITYIPRSTVDMAAIQAALDGAP
jgi:hypothetical protein